MIADDAYDELPDDPELAFIFLESLYRRKLEANLEAMDNSDALRYCWTEYMNHVIAAASGLELGVLGNWEIPTNPQEVYSAYQQFSTEVANYIVQIRIRHARRNRKYSVRLEDSEKRKIRHHVEQIKRLVEASTLLVEKKEAIYSKINALLLEVDKDRTRFEMFTDFASGLARVSGDFAREGAEPWFKLLRPIFEILGAEKEKEEKQTRLPAPEDRKKLEPPRQDGTGRHSSGDLDDDIPF